MQKCNIYCSKEIFGTEIDILVVYK